MQLLYFTPRFFPAISGGEFYIQSLEENLNSNYNDSTYTICSNSIDFNGLKNSSGLILPISNKNYYKYKNITIKRISPNYFTYKNAKSFNNSFKKLKYLTSKYELKIKDNYLNSFLENGLDLTNYFKALITQNDKLFNKKFEICHSTFLPYLSLIYSLIYSRYQKIPVICTPFYHIFNPRYNNPAFHQILNEFNAIIACTEVEKNFLINKGLDSNKIRVIPMGVNFNLYNNPIKSRSGKSKSFKKKFGIKNEFILYCGYKNYEKGALSLLKTIKNVSLLYPELYYVFIGPTTQAFDIELSKVRKQKNDTKILNLGPSNMKGYYDWKKISAFQECSIFVMPSRTDAYGMVYLEAWAAEKPVIGARNPVMEEVIQDNKDGLLIEFDNIRQLTEKIIFLLNNKEYAKKLGQNGKKKVKENNSWELIAEKTRNLYMEIISDYKNSSL